MREGKLVVLWEVAISFFGGKEMGVSWGKDMCFLGKGWEFFWKGKGSFTNNFF